MTDIKQQKRPKTPNYSGYSRAGYKYRQERVRTNASNEYSKYQQTETSANSPILYRQLFAIPKYNSQFDSEQIDSQPEDNRWQMYLGGPSEMEIGEQGVAGLLSDMKLICFRSQKVSEMSNFLQRKKMVIQKLRVEIEEKEDEVSRHKRNYERRYKEMMKRKLELAKYRRMIKEVQVSQKHWWALAMKRLQKKIDRRRIATESIASQYDSCMPQKKYSTKDRMQNMMPYHAPVVNHQQQHCSRRKNNSVYANYNHYLAQEEHISNDDTLILIEDPQRPGCYKIRRAPSLKKSQARTKSRTQGAEDNFIRMSKKMSNAVKYIEDFETSRQYEVGTYRAANKQDQALIKINGNTTDLITRQSPSSRSRKQVDNYLIPEPSPKREHPNIKQVISREVSDCTSQDADRTKKNWPRDHEDEQLAQLIEKSIRYKEEKHEKSSNKLFESDFFPDMLEMSQKRKRNFLEAPDAKNRSSSERNQQPSKIQIVVDPEGKFKKSEESRSESDTSDKRWSLKQPQAHMIVESLVKIDISDLESSKISKRSPRRDRSPSIPTQFARSRMRATMQQRVALIKEDPAQFGSLQTTQNNPEKKGKEVTPQNSLPKIQDGDQYTTPLKPAATDNEGGGLISSIQLNPRSKADKIGRKESNQFRMPGLFRQNNDDFLTGINLNSQSRISRNMMKESTEFKGSPRDMNEDIPAQKEINTKSEVKHQGRTSIEDQLGYDLDFELGANSRVLSKPPHMSLGKQLNRNSYPISMSSQPIEEQQSEESASNHIIRGRQTIKID